MKVLFNTQVNNNTFKSHSGYYKTLKGTEMGTYTNLYRNDLPWQQFTAYILRNFRHKDKVNIIQFAPSDGSEAYTQIISLLESTNNLAESDKFFPIQAYDVNFGMVRLANKGLINLETRDELSLNNYAFEWGRYFKTLPQEYSANLIYGKTYEVQPILRERVNFQQGDMLNLVSGIKDESNTIVFCRNCLGYTEHFSPNAIRTFIEDLANVLKKDSLFVVGDLERCQSIITDSLRNNGFKEVMYNVFKRL